MFRLASKKRRAFLGQKAPSAIFAVLVTLPLGVILAFLLLAIVATLAGLPGTELAAEGLMNALVLVALVQGKMLIILSCLGVLCFMTWAWKARDALWLLATGLFAKTPALMRVWRRLWTQAPSVVDTVHRPISQKMSFQPPERGLTGVFTFGLTPQLE